MKPAVSVSPPGPDDYPAWCALFEGYCAFYGAEITDTHASRVWAWLFDDADPSGCLLARDSSGVPVGLAHYRTWRWPLRGALGCYLDDLYVEPAHRGRGVATALILAIRDLALTHGWETVRWITREDNVRARKLYDRLAEATPLITYDLSLERCADPWTHQQ